MGMKLVAAASRPHGLVVSPTATAAAPMPCFFAKQIGEGVGFVQTTLVLSLASPACCRVLAVFVCCHIPTDPKMAQLVHELPDGTFRRISHGGMRSLVRGPRSARCCMCATSGNLPALPRLGTLANARRSSIRVDLDPGVEPLLQVGHFSGAFLGYCIERGQLGGQVSPGYFMMLQLHCFIPTVSTQRFLLG